MPRYVAGVDRGVLPMGLCVTSINLLKMFPFIIFPCCKFKLLEFSLIDLFTAFTKKPLIKLDFPEPDTPQQTFNFPVGIDRDKFFKFLNLTFSILNQSEL